ncbi:MAG: signal recognition particle-docking protein FtsY [Planctomycetota bacterium]
MTDEEKPATDNDQTKDQDAPTDSKPGFFGRIKRGISQTVRMTKDAVAQRVKNLKTQLNKTRIAFKKKVYKIFGSKRVLDSEAIDELYDALLSTDMGPKLADDIIRRVEEAYLDKEIGSAEKIIEFIKAEIKKDLPPSESEPKFAASGPTVVLVVGVNGTGKTTTIGKLAKHFKSNGLSVLLGAGDTFRAAAIEQLHIWAERAGVDIVSAQPGQDPGSVAYNAVEKAIARGYDIALIDTAGRLQDKENLMRELEKVDRVIKKLLPDAPHETLLVLDGTHGQNAVSQARAFSNVAGVSGLVITKLDGTAKGGAVLSLRKEVRLPLKYIGVGEKIDDLQRFIADEFIDALFDMTEETTFVEPDESNESKEAVEPAVEPAVEKISNPEPADDVQPETDDVQPETDNVQPDTDAEKITETQPSPSSSPDEEAPKKKGLFGRLFGR